jgi:hybrid polyketide synthase/nonribosomal peptide synthetase ACE1
MSANSPISDITDFESLERTYNQITSEMPGIAGVVQGAMVLDDIAVRNMTLKQLNNVIRPKVDGSLNLDRLFEDRPLDFFIFFSSSAGTVGNPGQANYSAANLFMSGLAEQRRRRGLAASVIDLGPVIGIGYITRELNDSQLQGILDRGGSPLSEIDVHYAFSEAVNASPADSSQPWHIMTGLERLPATASNRPQWQTYPQFACFTIKDVEHAGSSSEKQAGVVTLKEQLTHVSTTEELEVVIRG